MSLFTVVEFPEDNSVEVVPTKWIDFENNTCLYKDGPAGARLRRNSESIPQPEWPTYRVKIKAHYDDFMKASHACNQLQYTSQLDSSDSSDSEIDLGRRVRTRQPKVIFTPDDTPKRKKKTSNSKQVKKQKLCMEKSADVISNSAPLETDQLDPIFSVTNSGINAVVSPQTDSIPGPQSFQFVSLNFETPKQTEPAVRNQAAASNVFEEPLDDTSVLNKTQSTFSSDVSTPVRPFSVPIFDRTPLEGSSFVLEFRRFQGALFRELNEIKEDVRIIRSLLNKSDSTWSCPVEIPIASEAEFLAADAILSTEASRLQFHNWCEVLGGTDQKHHIRRALTRLFTHEFSLHVNLTGNSSKDRKKIAFKGTRICAALIGAVT